LTLRVGFDDLARIRASCIFELDGDGWVQVRLQVVIHHFADVRRSRTLSLFYVKRMEDSRCDRSLLVHTASFLYEDHELQLAHLHNHHHDLSSGFLGLKGGSSRVFCHCFSDTLTQKIRFHVLFFFGVNRHLKGPWEYTAYIEHQRVLLSRCSSGVRCRKTLDLSFACHHCRTAQQVFHQFFASCVACASSLSCNGVQSTSSHSQPQQVALVNQTAWTDALQGRAVACCVGATGNSRTGLYYVSSMPVLHYEQGHQSFELVQSAAAP
jgi:hypothetical protein